MAWALTSAASPVAPVHAFTDRSHLFIPANDANTVRSESIAPQMNERISLNEPESNVKP